MATSTKKKAARKPVAKRKAAATRKAPAKKSADTRGDTRRATDQRLRDAVAAITQYDGLDFQKSHDPVARKFQFVVTFKTKTYTFEKQIEATYFMEGMLAAL